MNNNSNSLYVRDNFKKNDNNKNWNGLYIRGNFKKNNKDDKIAIDNNISKDNL